MYVHDCVYDIVSVCAGVYISVEGATHNPATTTLLATLGGQPGVLQLALHLLLASAVR